MTELEKDVYTKEDVLALIQQELEPVELEYQKLKEEISRLTEQIEIQKKDYEKVKAYVARLAAHVETLEKEKADTSKQATSTPDMSEAIQEVREVKRHVDKSINAVIARAEKMEKLVAGYVFAEKDRLLDEITRIYEDCNVQDITAQRITKILQLLGDKDSLAKKKPNKTSDGVELESGPQMPEQAMSQADIDKLLKS